MLLDRNSATAMALRGILEDLIEKKRRSIERPAHDFSDTQLMRGELKAYRRMYREVDLKHTEEATDDE